MPDSLGTLILGGGTGEKLMCKGGGPSLTWCRMDKGKKPKQTKKQTKRLFVSVLFSRAGRGAGSLWAPAKESSAAEGISLLFHIPQIHFWHFWSFKGSSLGALSKPCGCHWELVPAMGLGWVYLWAFIFSPRVWSSGDVQQWVQVSLTTCSFSTRFKVVSFTSPLS